MHGRDRSQIAPSASQAAALDREERPTLNCGSKYRTATIVPAHARPFAPTRLATPRRIAITRPDGQAFEAWLGLACRGNEVAEAEAWLHPGELARAQAMAFPVRRAAFLLGRIAAKRALAGALGAAPVSEIAVEEGVFGQPIVAGPGRLPCIGIAHTGDWAAALAYDPRHPMGIDLESEDPTRSDAIRSQATVGELALLARLRLPEPSACTLLWTVKEALGKALTTGLMCPLWVYEVDAIAGEAGFQAASFAHFKQYRALSFMLAPGIRCAVALPRRSLVLTDMAALQA